MTKNWSKTQSKVIDITRTLATYNIDSKEKLIKKWSTDSKFLLSSYLLWVPSQLHNSIKHIWPPVTIKVDEITKEMTVSFFFFFFFFFFFWNYIYIKYIYIFK